MGALKHAIIPFFALMQIVSFFASMRPDRWGSAAGFGKLGHEPTGNEGLDHQQEELTNLHMLGAMRGINLALLIMCGMGITMESSHFRGVLAFALSVMYATTALDAYRLGLSGAMVPTVFSLLALAGAAINSLEPGLLTQDKLQRGQDTIHRTQDKIINITQDKLQKTQDTIHRTQDKIMKMTEGTILDMNKDKNKAH